MSPSPSALRPPAGNNLRWQSPLALPHSFQISQFSSYSFTLINHERYRIPRRRNLVQGQRTSCCSPRCVAVQLDSQSLHHSISCLQESLKTCALTTFNRVGILETSHGIADMKRSLMMMDLDPATAKLVIPFIGPFLSAFSFLFILRIVMSWYPKLPVGKFPYVLAYAPTEPLLIPTRKVIPPLGGVDVTPVVWFGLLSFLNEILVGPQGLLVLLSQQV